MDEKEKQINNNKIKVRLIKEKTSPRNFPQRK